MGQTCPLGTAAFVSAGGYHHHLGFNVWNGRGVGPPPEHSVGLGHWTVQLPAAATAGVRARLEASGYSVEPFADGFLVRDPWQSAVAFVEETLSAVPGARARDRRWVARRGQHQRPPFAG